MNATYESLAEIANLSHPIMRKLIQNLSNKTRQEQLQIFSIKQKIYSNLKTSNEQQVTNLKFFRQSYPATYDYYLLLLAIQIYNANSTKSQYVAQVREARQDISSLKTAPLYQAIQALVPLIDELRSTGATWDRIAKFLTTNQRKILSNRIVKTDYLKKTYARIKKTQPN